MAVRIDKWLWAVRIFKTRTKAAQACRSGKVSIAGSAVKPAHTVVIGDVIQVKQRPIIRSYQVTGLVDRRVSACLAAGMVRELTAAEDLEVLRLFHRDPLHVILAPRQKGAGRPTKKERRKIIRLRGDKEP